MPEQSGGTKTHSSYVTDKMVATLTYSGQKEAQFLLLITLEQIEIRIWTSFDKISTQTIIKWATSFKIHTPCGRFLRSVPQERIFKYTKKSYLCVSHR